ncbi:MAG: InlB B-repeat-containing protein [Roseburia sp.]|nr:InlB B-repeat-containing protein [Roseburia sp.]
MCKRRIVLLIVAITVALCGCALFGCAEKGGGLADERTVTFYYNYDGAPDDGVYKTETVALGGTVSEPSAPVRADYDFDGWLATSDGTQKIDVASALIIADTSFYAAWKEKAGSGNNGENGEGDNNGETPTQPTLTEIVLTSLPTKLEYRIGEQFSADGLVVTAKYSDGSSSVVASSQYTVTVVDTTTSGVKTITVTHSGKTKTFDITVLARYTVSYSANSGSYTPSGMPASDSAAAGDKITAPTAPTLKGFAFSGWYTTAACATADAWDFDTSTVTTATTLYAKWSPNTYAVAYDLDGGTNGANPTTYTAVGNVFQNASLADADKERYDFDGWFTSSDFAANTEVTALSYDLIPSIGNTITLYAKFTPKTYTIEYVFGGSASTYEAAFKQGAVVAYSYQTGSSVQLPDVSAITVTDKTSTEYNFLGWCAQSPADASQGYVTAVSASEYGNKTFYAHIAAVPVYTVTFDKNYTGSTSTQVNVPQGNTVDEIPAPTRVGYEFLGWKRAGTAWDFDTPINENIVLTAEWNKLTYNISYKWGSADVSVGNAYKTYDVDSADITLPTPAEQYYTFDGWYTAQNLSGTAVTKIDKTFIGGLSASPVGGAVSVTLYAKYTEITYTVAYVLDGGTNAIDNPTSYVVTSGEVDLGDATKDWYTFIGWYSDAQKTQAVSSLTEACFNPSAAATLTLYAKFEKTAYTVNFSLPAAPINAVNTQNNIAHGTFRIGDAAYTLEAATTAAAGYYFVGWKNGSADVTQISQSMFDATGATTSVTIVAQFSNTYTVTFDVVGGTLGAGATAEAKLTYGSLVTPPAVTKSGSTLVGWYTDSAYTPANKWNTETGTVSGNVTLYAKWMENPDDGVYLLGTFNNWSMFDENIADYKFEEFATGETKYSIGRITLAVDDEFKVVKYEDGDVDYDTLNVYDNVYTQSNDIIRLSHDDNFAVTALGAIAKETFTIHVGTNTSGKYISFVLDARNPSYASEEVDAKADATAAVYLRGTFSKEFGSCDAWSSDSEIIDVKVIGNTYYFQNVYLAAYDEFKIYVTATDNATDKWLGGTFAALGSAFTLSANNAPNIAPELAAGYYNIVFENGATQKLTVYAHADITASVKSDPIYVGQTPTLADIEYSGATLTAANISAEAAKAGTNEIRIIYNGSVIDLTYTATAVELSSIEIKTAPDKTYYVETETFDETGLVITAVYNNGDRVDKTSGFNITTPEWTVGNNKVVTVAYTDGVRKTATFTINIVAKVITSVEYTGTLTKTSYTVGETFDASGLTFTVTYNDGEVKHPTAAQMTFAATGMNASNVFTANGTPQIEVSYDGAKAAHKLSVSVGVATVTITYYDYVGATAVPVVYEKDSAVAATGDNAPRTPASREGYTFDGWYKESALSTEFDGVTWSASISLYGKWSEIEYSVSYNLGGGTNHADNPTVYTVSDGEVTLEDPTPPTGKQFDGWYTALTGGTKVTAIDLALFDGETSKTLFALYTDREYTVSFSGNKPQGVAATVSGLPADRTVVHGNTTAEPDAEPTLSGYEFGGWYKTSACADGGEWSFATDTVTSDTVIYAKWTPIVLEDGLYANGVLVKAFSDNGTSGSLIKLKAENVNLAKDAVLTAVYNHTDLAIVLRTGNGMSSRIKKVGSDIKVSNLATGKTHGMFSFYYASSGNEAGFWISDCEDYEAPDLRDGDGLYSGTSATPVIEFEINENGANEVKAEGFLLTAATTLTVKYGGENKSVTLKTGSPYGTISSGKIVLQAGEYSVYYSYSQNTVWIEGTPDEPAKPSIAGYSYEAVTSSNAYLVGKFDGLTSFVSDEGFKMLSHNGSEVKVEGFRVAANAGIKVRYNGGWYGYDNVHSQYGNKDLVTYDNDRNMVFKTAGTYNIYFNTSTHDIYLATA